MNVQKHPKKRLRKTLKDIPASYLINACTSELKEMGDNVLFNEDEAKLRKVNELNPDEALALFVDAKLTKAQYELIREKLIKRNCFLFSSYKKIIDAKKCYPPLEITENSATICLQDLLNHTVERMVEWEDVNNLISNCGQKDFLLIRKYGGDGCSGFNPYYR